MGLGGGRSSRTEKNAFQNAYDAGVLPIAAAGNAGNTQVSYPAGYASVVSVAAVDSARAIASFSQQNADVEIAAPGVSVLSTTPFKPSSVSANSSSWPATDIDGSARLTRSGSLVDGELCGSSGSWYGKVVLCKRGSYSFASKVTAVQAGGGVAAIIYNDVPGSFAGTMNGTSTTIPAVGISGEDGLTMRNFFGQNTSVDNAGGVGNGYEAWDGTSMATPHVAGVAALVWSLNPTRTAAEIRNALNSTALDLGNAGRDNAYGFGLVQAKAAHDALNSGGGGGGGGGSAPDMPSGFTAIQSADQTKALLSWSDVTGETGYEIERQKRNTRNGSWGSTTILPIGQDNNAYEDTPGGGTFRYRIRAMNGTVGSDWTSPHQEVTLSGSGGGGKGKKRR
jgi:subtilisin family serine protease